CARDVNWFFDVW
nr:immunoglobulin heavy chain junction region [Mus musculus]MBK4183988.1 immunoglobulin heavy chain junction region [Mus musculus]MBK4183991.1 immunoglobulin heavy chain junction region [Mus musculus]MBK4183992.1 immunoglobulin heavy chain junction region [Mus musculus]